MTARSSGRATLSLETLSEQRCFGGVQGVYAHASKTTGCRMTFALYRPPQADAGPVPVVFYLSGLTCTWENATTKAGFQRAAAEHGLIVVTPDTSPRGLDLPGEDDAYDFGTGAGFYVDATVQPWSQHYRMYSYVTEELPALIARAFPADTTRIGLTGHSMGGHGALVCALRRPERFGAVSAFAPIASPMRCPWGKKALSGYLGPDPELWEGYDATALARKSHWRSAILIDQGLADGFLESQLRPELLEAACAQSGIPLILRRHEGYDHSYYFVQSFIADHLAHHARLLCG